MNLKKIFILFLLASVTLSLFSLKKNKKEYEKEVLTDYSQEEIKNLFIPTGKPRKPLNENDPVYFKTLNYLGGALTGTINVENNDDDMKQIGMISLELKKRVKKIYDPMPWDPNSTDFYVYLKDFARSIGANVIKVSNVVVNADQKGKGMTYIMKVTFEFGYKAE